MKCSRNHVTHYVHILCTVHTTHHHIPPTPISMSPCLHVPMSLCVCSKEDELRQAQVELEERKRQERSLAQEMAERDEAAAVVEEQYR